MFWIGFGYSFFVGVFICFCVFKYNPTCFLVSLSVFSLVCHIVVAVCLLYFFCVWIACLLCFSDPPLSI